MKNLAINLFNEVLNGKNGNTFDLNGNVFDPKKGYFVGITGFQVPKNYFINPKYPINTLLFSLEEYLDLSKNLVGYWVENNIIYIDSVIHTEDYYFAFYLGSQFNQKAIFDIKNNKSIYL